MRLALLLNMIALGVDAAGLIAVQFSPDSLLKTAAIAVVTISTLGVIVSLGMIRHANR